MFLKIEKIAEKLVLAQLKKPYLFLLCCSIITIGAGIYAYGLTFDSSYEALLPPDSAQIKNVDDVRKQTGGTRQFIIAIKGKNPKKRIEFAKKITPKLKKLPHVRCVDLEFPVDFFQQRALWFAQIETLDKLVPAVQDAVTIAKTQANPLALHLDEEAEKEELAAAWKKVEEISKKGPKDGKTMPFEKFLHSKDNKYTFLLLVPTIKFSDMKLANQLVAGIKKTVSDANPTQYNLAVQYAGALEVLHEQHIVMQKDMVTASILAVILGILLIVIFTRNILAPVIVSGSLLAGIVWTFAMARLYVGHVNIITGFLVAVLVGLGIDFGIHLYVRYLQEIKNHKQTAKEAYVRFVKGTAVPALTAGLTTAGVFFSFSVADFRGFSEFGLIAGTGVIFTLLSSFLVLPPLLMVIHRNPHSKKTRSSAADATILKKRIPIPVATIILFILFSMAIYGGISVNKISFRNDFRELRGYSEATKFFDYVNKNLGAGFNPTVFLANSIQDAAKLEAILNATKQTNRGGHPSATVGKVMSINALLPKDVDAHKARIAKLDDILWAPALDKAAKKDTPMGQKLRDARKMVHTESWTAADIPEMFKRRFMTIDSKDTKFIVYAWSKQPHEADYLAAQWQETLKSVSTQLDEAGVKHQKADETLIISWVYEVVKADGVPMLVLASLVVLILLTLDFRNAKDVVLLVTTLAAGMLIFVGLLHVLEIDLNMFNMVVIPSVIGIGIDNAVHILHRYRQEGPGSIPFVLKHTGAAALLASITTAVGFGASIVAHNLGLKSLGFTAMLGIGVTFISAVFLLPSLLTLIEKRNS